MSPESDAFVTAARTHAIAADVAKILAGLQVPPDQSDALDEALQSLGYPFVEETDNQVYRDFLDDDDEEE